MKPEIKVGQVRQRVVAGLPAITIIAENKRRKDWKVQFSGGRVTRMTSESILECYPLVTVDAPPEAKAVLPTMLCRECGWSGGRHSNGCLFSEPSAPSPLEVVRASVDWLHASCGAMGANLHRERILSALATLEESIRADEREACAKVAGARAVEWNDVAHEAIKQGEQDVADRCAIRRDASTEIAARLRFP